MNLLEKKMTWNELKTFISNMESNFLDTEVLLYDFNTGDEYVIDVTELMLNGWTPYLSINNEEINNEAKTEETSFS
jgi:hypothetical protein